MKLENTVSAQTLSQQTHENAQKLKENDKIRSELKVAEDKFLKSEEVQKQLSTQIEKLEHVINQMSDEIEKLKKDY